MKSLAVKLGMILVIVLGILFIVLKIKGNIDWRWIWIFAPFWMGFVISIVILVGLICLYTFREQ